jgi:hypothetical protein
LVEQAKPLGWNRSVSGSELPNEREIEDAHNRLAEGLKSCRSVVANYRAMIANDAGDDAQAVETSSQPADEKPAPTA